MQHQHNIQHNALELPWKFNNVPHALIDIIRGCNVVCRNCCNSELKDIKPLEQIEKELKQMLSLRKLHSVALIGGEPFLHPNIKEILQLVSGYVPHIEIFTNGTLLTNENLRICQEFGVKIIFLHIEEGQKRPDLSGEATSADVQRLRKDLAEKITAYGMEAALSMTSYKNKMEEITKVINDSIEDPNITYLLVTLFRDMKKIKHLTGDIQSGIKGEVDGTQVPSDLSLTSQEVIEHMHSTFKMLPFAYLGSNKSSTDMRWISYYLGVLNSDPDSGQETISHAMKPSALEKIYLFLYHLFTRRYPFYQEQDDKKLKSQMKLNGLLGGDKQGNRKFLKKIKGKRGKLKTLRLLFQSPATINENGELTHCNNCPDAVIKNGKLVPVCVADWCN